MVRFLRNLPVVFLSAMVIGLVAVSLYPLLDRHRAEHDASEQVERAREHTAAFGERWVVTDEWLLAVRERGLASWGNIGGCGVSGAATATGGVKWVGRGVTGGLVDLQCILSQTGFEDGASQATFSTRLGTSIGYKWLVAATVPFRYNVEEVFDGDISKGDAHLPGFGDISLEGTRKLGITNAHTVTLALTIPTGAHDAVRRGVVLPQRMQLGTGVMGVSGVYEFTRDFDWGPMIFGGNVFYGGWENSINEREGDFRGSGASGYVYAGYMLGPLVPSVGLNLTAKITGDRQDGFALAGQPMVMVSPTVALEWSVDWLAVLLSASMQLSLFEGSDPLFGGAGNWKAVFELETWTIGLGVQASIF
jgi:hypothetical protein